MKVFDDAVNDVLIGVEFEVDMGGRRDSTNIVKNYPELFEMVTETEVYNARTQRWEPQSYENGISRADATAMTACGYPLNAYIDGGAWGVKDESPMGCEWNYATPQPFGAFLDSMNTLLEWMKGYDKTRGIECKTGPHMGMHVHVNVNPEKGAHVAQKGLVDAYFAKEAAWQSRWFDTQERTTGRGRGYEYCRVATNVTETKYSDIRRTNYGSVELRAWDTTRDWKTMEKRADVLGGLIEAALEAV